MPGRRARGALLLAPIVLLACNAVLGLDQPERVSRDHCSVIPQAGCNANETCQVVGDDGRRECLAAGPVARGGTCTGDSECAPGLTCAPTGSCAPYCAGDNDCNGKCVQLNAEGEVPVPGKKVCFIQCTPKTPQCNGGSCEYFADLEGFTCTSAGSGTQGAACKNPNDCSPGFSCTTVAKVSACRKRCEIGRDLDCPPDLTCLAFNPRQIVDGTEYGACASCVTSPQARCKAGQTCDLQSTTAYLPTCVNAGSGKLGAPCTTTSECQEGLACPGGVCLEYCPTPEVGAEICKGPNACDQFSSTSGPVPGAYYCRVRCDPVAPSACNGSTCVVRDDFTTTCARSKGGALGTVCENSTDCAPGLVCDAKKCAPWCSGVGSQGTCASGQTCKAPPGGLTVHGVPLGTCK